MRTPNRHGPRGGSLTGGLAGAVLDASADGIVAVDDSGVVRCCNRAAEDMLGRAPGTLQGSALGHDLVPGQAAEIVLSLPGEADRVLDVRTGATATGGDRLRIASLRDITHRRLSERALEAVLERESAALAVAGHELQSPLAAIGVLAGVLADEEIVLPRQELTQIAQRVVDLTGHLQMLMRRLLTSARIDAGGRHGAPEQVSVLEVVIEQLAIAGSRADAIKVSCGPGLNVLTDRAELAMMLANYIDNAVTHADPPIEISAAERGDCAEITVSDAGPGVPADFAFRLFERFARGPGTTQRTEGLGLGLWIVRTLARANDGEAWYEPGQGSGSRFCLRLPLAAAERP